MRVGVYRLRLLRGLTEDMSLGLKDVPDVLCVRKEVLMDLNPKLTYLCCRSLRRVVAGGSAPVTETERRQVCFQ